VENISDPFKRRVLIIVAILAVWVVAMEARLVQLQVFRHDEMVERATSQQQRLIHPAALRGDIVDSSGRILAYSLDADAVFADPSLVEDASATAQSLCEAFGDCSSREQSDLAGKLTGTGKYVLVRHSRAVSPEQAQRVRLLKLKGVGLFSEPARYYPNFELAAHVLGFVGLEDTGRGGVESAFDSVIRGQEGLVFVQQDAKKKWMQTRIERPPTAGATLELSIDLTLQYIAERELRAGIQATHARGGTAIIMDPRSGEIRALANYPTFNPNSYGRFSDDERRNRAIQDVYEPGSTFKIVTASAAIEEGVISPTDLIDTSPGYIKFPGRKPISDTHPHGVLTFEDVIVKSSNVGAIKAGLRVGADRLARYVRRFGFGETLGNDFRGESAGIVWSPDKMDDSALASMSMGYQVSVTPLQMALAASAVANGGLLYEPHLVRAVIHDGVRDPVAPKVLRRAITAETAATMTTIMEGVVDRGTARAARLDRYAAAGKTGTSSKIVDGRYSQRDYNSSFVGFAPSRRPELTVLVVIDSPQGGKYYGGDVAAPVFKRIATAALQHLGVQPTVDPISPVLVQVDRRVDTEWSSRTTVIPALTDPGSRAVMPDVRGLSMRDAIRLLSRAGMSVRVSGDGIVATQTPEPGEALDPGGWSVLQLRRAAPEPAAPGGGGR
jgi:cell division protein FtsI (penicillin-binding protein 3)